jgi:modulator of FtsH protease
MNQSTVTRAGESSLLATHTVLRNTYFLLSLTLLFSAATAGYAMISQAAPVGILLFLVGSFGLLFLTGALRNSAWGIVSVFAFTGFMGYTLGPMLNSILSHYSNGSSIITAALVSTGATFFALSAYALTTRKDFSSLRGFIMSGLIGFIILSLLNTFWLHMPAIYLACSAAFVLIASALILYDTSRIINNGERNYIMATISLYMDIYILFTNLLTLFSVLSGRD